MDNFEKLVAQYEPLIYKIMETLHIYKNKDEFYQIGLIALWDASKGFQPEKGTFLNYAYTYIKGRMMTELSRMNRHDDRSVTPDETFWEMIEDDSLAHRPFELDTLLSYCEDLTDRERKWVIYHFYFGMQQAQIAPLEGVTTHAVQKWRRGALRKLRESGGQFA